MPNNQDQPRRSPSEKATSASPTPPDQDAGKNAQREGPRQAGQTPPRQDRVDEVRPGRQEPRGRADQGPGGQGQARAQGASKADPTAGPLPSRRPMKEFRDFIDAVTDLPFAKDHDRAEMAVRTVLGAVAVKLSADDAREITKNLPEPLDLEALRSQRGVDVAQQLRLDQGQSEKVIRAVLKTLRGCIPEDQHKRVQAALPQGWERFFGDNA